MKNYKFIVNPVASRGKSKKVGRWLEKKCREQNMDFDLQFTTKPKEASEIASKSYENFEYIVAVGGDGTLQEVINGLIGIDTKVGIIPVGTGNDFVRAANLPHHPNEALEILLKGQTKKVDIGKVNDRYFHNGVGAGFDAWVVHESLKIKYLRGKVVYLLAILKTIFSYKAPYMEISYNEKTIRDKLFLITIANGTCLGGGIKLTPFAKIDDGELDLNIIYDVNKLKILRNLIKAYSGEHVKLPEVKVDRCTSFSVNSENGLAVHADGELLGCNINELNINIIPKAIKFVVQK